MKESVISINRLIQGGIPCFRGTRVPISTIFDYLEQGSPLDEFLEDFPTVTHEQAIELLELAKADMGRHTEPAAT